MHGGKRNGSGRKPGARLKSTQIAIDVASQVLKEIDAVKVWKGLLTSGNPNVISDVMKYLTDRVHGKPRQVLEGGDKPISIRLVIGNGKDSTEW